VALILPFLQAPNEGAEMTDARNGTASPLGSSSPMPGRIEPRLLQAGVAVEKLVFRTNGLKFDERKCLPGPRKSLVGHPGAMNV